ncbi:hypothetical protein B0H11DRAFT_1753408, partial [Mycena galericulata]
RQNLNEGPTSFPPEPVTQAIHHRTVNEMCQSFTPDKIEESGCTVCGLLTPNYELTDRSALDLDWSLLKRPGVTRLERKSSSDPIREIEGPILDDSSDYENLRSK